jgi:hypothetical protein
MRKIWIGCVLAVSTLAAVGRAELCTIDAVPAATLLLPYFEVDLDDPSGVDTFFSVNNALEQSVLTHVVVWTDMSVEALDFNVYLTGYDVQTVGLGLILRNGVLPRTATSAISPRGPYSGPHPSYAGCTGVLPYGNPALDADFLTHLQSILTGGPSAIYGGRCGGFDHGDAIARGYVTVDVVADCTLLTPCDPGYFVSTPEITPEDLVGRWDNAIWGDWYLIDYASNFAQGDTLVHVEALAPASPGSGPAPVPPGFGEWTFWGRCAVGLAPGAQLLDNREPLPSTFAAAYFLNEAFSGGTDFLVWRDSIFDVASGEEDGFSCVAGPSWYPLRQRQVVFFDENENPNEICTLSPCPEEEAFFPLESQRVVVAELGVAPQCGWAYLNLNQSDSIDETILAGQAWVTLVQSAEGRYSAGLAAIQLDSVCDFSSVLLGPAPDFPADEGSCPAQHGCPSE